MQDEVIQISNVQAVQKNSLFATCDVYIRPLDLELCRVCIFQKGANRWLGMPSAKWEGKDGETKFEELVKFRSDATKKRFRDQVMQAIDKYLMQNPNLDPEPFVDEMSALPF